MKITLLCSDINHPIYPYLIRWVSERDKFDTVDIINDSNQLTQGDFLFLVSCDNIIKSEKRSKYKNTLVLHASDLPHGRGWSPHIWDILNGAEYVTLSLIEAADLVDSGRIWKKLHLPIPNHALWNEINNIIFEAEIKLINFAVNNYNEIEPTDQCSTEKVTYYPRRNPEDSCIDPHKTISEQFNLIRVCDPNRYPAFFYHLGCRYAIKIEKSNVL